MTFLAAAAALLVLAPQDIPRMDSPVVDLAGVLTPVHVREALAISQALEASDSTQLTLLVVKTTGGKDIGDYALEVGRVNKIGRGGTNNGVLIVVAVQDRKTHIAVGYGLEAKLPDALASRIIRDEMIPRFIQGDYGGGSVAGMKAVSGVVKGEYVAKPSNLRRKKTIGWGVMLLLILIAMIFSRRGGGLGGFFTGYMIGGMLGGGGRGGGWGGGGGGGGGGWSGGGGSFGGGGASGSW